MGPANEVCRPCSRFESEISRSAAIVTKVIDLRRPRTVIRPRERGWSNILSPGRASAG